MIGGADSDTGNDTDDAGIEGGIDDMNDMNNADIVAHNSRAWDGQVERGNEWTAPVGPDIIADAKAGRMKVWLTDKTPVPDHWFQGLRGKDALCLASGGGQQAPILAAAGYNVTSYDNSPRQLAQDRFVADRDGLRLRAMQGDMADLSAFPDASFDLVFHPISNLFAPSPLPVWREAFRALRPGGVLMAGFLNPMEYIFDAQAAERGELIVRHSLPYSDAEDLSDEERSRWLDKGSPLEFGHTLSDQIGGQLAAGFVITGFYEDRRLERPRASQNIESLLSRHSAIYIATRAVKPAP